MPMYVVVDSQDKWLEVGDYPTPEEAITGGMEAQYFDDPQEIWVYEYTDEFHFVKNEEGEYVKEG